MEMRKKMLKEGSGNLGGKVHMKFWLNLSHKDLRNVW